MNLFNHTSHCDFNECYQYFHFGISIPKTGDTSLWRAMENRKAHEIEEVSNLISSKIPHSGEGVKRLYKLVENYKRLDFVEVLLTKGVGKAQINSFEFTGEYGLRVNITWFNNYGRKLYENGMPISILSLNGKTSFYEKK